jgi:hypothetical protein
MGWWWSGRILTFEIFGDASVTVAEILNDASRGVIGSSEAQELTGYAAYGQSIKAAVQPLVDCFAVELFDDGSRLVTPGAAAMDITDDELGNSSDSQKAARIQRQQIPASSLPSVVRLSYYDPALDYQSGEARASSADRRGTENQQQLPAAVSAGEAKSLAQAMIARAWAQRDKLTLRLPPRYLALQPGSEINLNLSPRTWTVEQTTIDAYVVVTELRPTWTVDSSLAADSGRIVANQDEPAANLTVALFDIPDVLEQGFATPTLMLAASAPASGWKSYPVEIAAGEQTLQVQTARRKSVLGFATTALDIGDPYLINTAGAIDVELIDPDQWLVSCDDDALIGGANLAVLGSEVVQFGTVEALGVGRFRLSRLLRGRGGTEWAMGTHTSGEPFALLDRDGLTSVSLPSWAVGASITASIVSLAGTSASAPVTLSAESVRPVSPVDVDAGLDADGNLAMTWTRRSRSGFAWIDGIDAPIGESSEQYSITVTGSQSAIGLSSAAPMLEIAAAERAEAGSGPFTIEVRQLGDAGASRPAALTLNV